jgi:hypothetical protein
MRLSDMSVSAEKRHPLNYLQLAFRNIPLLPQYK